MADKRPAGRTSAEVCARKRRFLSDADAKRAAERTGMTYYRCSACHRFHLTKMPLKRQRFVERAS